MKLWLLFLCLHWVGAIPGRFIPFLHDPSQESTRMTTTTSSQLDANLSFLARQFPWIITQFIYTEMGLYDRIRLSRTCKLFQQLEPISLQSGIEVWDIVDQVTQYMRNRVDIEIASTHDTLQRDQRNTSWRHQQGHIRWGLYAFIPLKSVLNKPPFTCLSSSNNRMIYEFMAFKGWNTEFIDRIHSYYKEDRLVPKDMWETWQTIAAKFQNQVLYDFTLRYSIPTKTSMEAAMAGSNLTFIQYNFLKHPLFINETIPFTVVSAAAMYGRVDILDYVLMEYPYLMQPACLELALMAALRGGHVSVVGWLFQYHDNMDHHSNYLDAAIQSNQLPLVQYLVQQRGIPLTLDACRTAMITGQYDIILYSCQHPSHFIPLPQLADMIQDKVLSNALPFLRDTRVLDFMFIILNIQPYPSMLNKALFYGNDVLYIYLVESGFVSPDHSMLSSAYSYCVSPSPLECDTEGVVERRMKIMNYLCRYISVHAI